MLSVQALAMDISGVQLGDSLANAKSAIANANSKFSMSPLKLTNGKEAGVIAVTAERIPGRGITDAGGPSDEFVALQDESGKVWFLARSQRLVQGSRIKIDVLIASLKEKFGEPSGEIPILSGLGRKWEFDRNGKQYVGPAGKGPCATISLSDSIPGTTISAPHSFSPNCGKLITATTGSVIEGMISHYTLNVIDAQSMYDQLNAREAQAEKERKKKLEQEKAQGTKPNI